MSKYGYFAAGLIIGSAVAFFMLRDHLRRQECCDPQEEPIDIFSDDVNECRDAEGSIKNEYSKLVRDTGYTHYGDHSNDNQASINFIPPDCFGEIDDYQRETLTYYSDGVLADNDMSTIYDDVVGDFRERFGEYEEDSVYVRNDDKECYYEILRDERTYDEALSEKPYLNEDSDGA